MKTQPELTILIPVFNGQAVLGDTFQRFEEMFEKTTSLPELLFVDDGSTDASFTLLKRFREGKENVRVVRLATNHGHQTALHVGFERAAADIIGTTEMALEHDPAEIFRMRELLTPDVDVVNARRVGRQDPWWRIFPSCLINSLVRNLCGLPVHDMNCLLKVWRRPAGLLASASPSYGHYLHTLSRLRLVETPVVFSLIPRTASTLSLGHLVRAALQIIATASVLRLWPSRPYRIPAKPAYTIQEIL